MYIRKDLSPEECQKCRDRFGSCKATGTGSSSADSHNAVHSQPLTAQSQSLSPRDLQVMFLVLLGRLLQMLNNSKASPSSVSVEIGIMPDLRLLIF